MMVKMMVYIIITHCVYEDHIMCPAFFVLLHWLVYHKRQWYTLASCFLYSTEHLTSVHSRGAEKLADGQVLWWSFLLWHPLCLPHLFHYWWGSSQCCLPQMVCESGLCSIVHSLLHSFCPILYDTCGTNTLTMCSTSCKFRVDEGATYCQNRSCPTVTLDAFASEPHYSILISLSDHTGGIDGVRLSGQPASDLLQQTVGKLNFSWLL